MPSRTLPTFTRAEVEKHNSEKSCYVTIGSNVYDVTDFAGDHPGGADLLLEYAGKDVEEILKDVTSHPHSEAAYDVLEDSLVGFLDEAQSVNGVKVNGDAAAKGRGARAVQPNGDIPVENVEEADKWVHPRTGMASEEGLSKETDPSADYRKHKFLDLNKPLLMQVWCGGFTKEFYLDQVHRPRHYKGGASAPLFGNFLEPLSLTPWWLIPTLYLPCVSYGLFYAVSGTGFLPVALSFGLGLFAWTLIEYCLHRFIFHMDYWLPDNRVGITLHFLFHGIHHYLPMDRYRLVLPPALLAILAPPFYRLAHAIIYWNWYAALGAFCGGIFGYVCYDMTHYFLHHRNLPLWYRELKKYHLQHHFLDYENGFGVSNRFWDRVFGTELPPLVKGN